MTLDPMDDDDWWEPDRPAPWWVWVAIVLVVLLFWAAVLAPAWTSFT